MNYISAAALKRQRWKFYFVAVAWPVFVLGLPWAFHHSILLALALMVFPGGYLFTWAGLLMHEAWHRYVPGVPNETFYNYFSWILLTDPQIYKVLHGTHHAQVNSWDDREFHPLGHIAHPVARRVFNVCEILLGVGFIVVVSSLMLPLHPQFKQKYRFTSMLLSVLVIAVFFGGVVALNRAGLHVPGREIAAALLLNVWVDSLLLHHSQLIEHGNLIVAGDWSARNLKVRNLRADGIAEKLFLFLTHGDAKEHVLHHTLVSVYSRPFPGTVSMPSDAVYITLKDYGKILVGMLTQGA